MRGTLFLHFFCLLLSVSSQQECDTSIDSTQCSEGEVCRNDVCKAAVPCGSGADCGGTSGTSCVADYCQPPVCAYTGQCVHGQICSGQCVYPVNLRAEENTELALNFSEPGTVGTYEEITWYKGDTLGYYRIVSFHSIITEGKPEYYGDYCSGSSPCDTSDKGELNVDTGDFTIYNVQPRDDAYYYYKFSPGIGGGIPDTGNKYEIKLEVSVPLKLDQVSLEGISDRIEEAGTKLDLTCTIKRIKPEAAEMYWVVNGRRENGSITNVTNGDGTFSQTNVLEYTVAKEDENKLIKCVVVPVYGERAEVQQTVYPGYGPTGKPDLQPPRLEKHAGEKVELTCNNPVDDGNPPCAIYTWNKVEGNGGTFPNTHTLEFIMDESSAGNYTCMCRNIYSFSDVSDQAEVVFLDGAAPVALSDGSDAGLIVGVVIGILALIIIVIVAIVLCRKLKINVNVSRRDMPPQSATNAPVAIERPNAAYEDVHNPTPNRPHEYATINEKQCEDGYLQPVTNRENIPVVYDDVEGPSQGAAGGRGIRGDTGYVNQAVVKRDYENVGSSSRQADVATRAYEDIL